MTTVTVHIASGGASGQVLRRAVARLRSLLPELKEEE